MANIDQDYIDFTPGLASAKPNEGGGGYNGPADGEHEMEIKEAILGHTKKGDKMMLTVQYVVAEGDDKGKECRSWFVLDPDSEFNMGRLRNLLDAAGVAVDANGGFSKNALIGARLLVTVESKKVEDGLDNEGRQKFKTMTNAAKERAVVAAAAPKVVPPALRNKSANGPAARR